MILLEYFFLYKLCLCSKCPQFFVFFSSNWISNNTKERLGFRKIHFQVLKHFWSEDKLLLKSPITTPQPHPVFLLCIASKLHLKSRSMKTVKQNPVSRQLPRKTFCLILSTHLISNFLFTVWEIEGNCVQIRVDFVSGSIEQASATQQRFRFASIFRSKRLQESKWLLVSFFRINTPRDISQLECSRLNWSTLILMLKFKTLDHALMCYHTEIVAPDSLVSLTLIKSDVVYRVE